MTNTRSRVEVLYSTPETNSTLWVNWNLNKNIKKIKHTIHHLKNAYHGIDMETYTCLEKKKTISCQ